MNQRRTEKFVSNIEELKHDTHTCYARADSEFFSDDIKAWHKVVITDEGDSEKHEDHAEAGKNDEAIRHLLLGEDVRREHRHVHLWFEGAILTGA